MRLLVLLTLFLAFSSFAKDDYVPIDDSCANNCSISCQNQVKNFTILLRSHQLTCFGEEPVPNLDHVCAYSCAWGCRTLMRSMTSLARAHYLNCGGGLGGFGQLECVRESGNYYVKNNITGQKYGDGISFASQCEELLRTEYFGTFCSKRHGDFYLTNKATGATYNNDINWLDDCREIVRTGDHRFMCVRISTRVYKLVGRASMKTQGGEFYSLRDCERAID